MRIVLTGANGFVGKSLLKALLGAGHSIVAPLRCPIDESNSLLRQELVAGLDAGQNWQSILREQEVVIHCAARVHVMEDRALDPLAEFRRINVDGTMHLARQAVAAGVRRFIFISSIKVNGEGTPKDAPYFADDPAAPVDPYGVSKMEAEQKLRVLAAETGMEVVIIRPVLIYGPGVKANFLSMMRWLQKGVPLPLGAIRNRRSLVFLDNLVDLIDTCIHHPAAGNQTLLVSDGEDLSTTELLRRMAAAMDQSARLLPVPSWLLKAGSKILGKQVFSQRLCGSLQVDIDKTCDLLNWQPPVKVDDALRKTAKYFLEQQHK